MCAYVIGVVRSARRLDTLAYEASEPVDKAQPWKREHRCELRPIREGTHPELSRSWRALEAVRDWDDETLGHVLTVLRGTVPNQDTPSDLPLLRSNVQEPSEPRATAAHPRAYRGTKYRPPKPRQPDKVDVRPYLLTRRHTDQVLEQLGQPRGLDPYGSWNHGGEAGTSLDAAFVMTLLPLLRGCSWGDVGAFAGLSRTLDLHVLPDLRAALIGVYLAADDPRRALGWWSHVLAHDVDQRLEVAHLVCASGVTKHDPFDPGFAAQIAQLPAVQQWSIYRGAAGGASPPYVLSGFELGAISPSKLDEVPPGRLNVTSLVEATTARLDAAMDEDSGADFWRSQLWRLCGYQPEIVELLGSPDFTSLTPEAAFWTIRIANTPRSTPEAAEQQWRELAPKLSLLVEFATRVAPEYQRKLVEDMGDVYWWALDNEHDITDALAHGVDLCFRIAKPPF